MRRYSVRERFFKSDNLGERQTREGNDSKLFRCIEDCFFILSSAVSESQASELKFPLKQKISGLQIRSESGLNDGDGQTTEGDSSDEDDEEYHTASPAVMCLKVGKEKINKMYEQ